LSDYETGSKLFAKWNDDIWYNASVSKIDNKTATVTFTDYGNVDEVPLCNLAKEVTDIPKSDLIDEGISQDEVIAEKNLDVIESEIILEKEPEESPEKITKTSKIKENENLSDYETGSKLFAKWNDDIWYNASVSKIDNKTATVTFTDYGNVDEVPLCNLAKEVTDIPKTDLIDEGVIEEDENVKVPDPQNVTTLIEPAEVRLSTLEVISEENSGNVQNEDQFMKGEKVFAKWQEDEVWYNATVEEVMKGDLVSVIFVDYGNSAKILKDNVFRNSDDIPVDEEADENIVFAKSRENIDGNGLERKEIIAEVKLENIQDVDQITKGEKVFAKWQDDEVWYNATVEEVKEDFVSVIFVDYGNSAEILKDKVLRNSDDIPMDEDADENIVFTNSRENGFEGKEAITEVNIEIVQDEGQITEGEKVFAKWQEDEVWYNATVEKVKGDFVSVIFVDYGNSAEILKDRVVRKSDDIPVDEDADENIVFINCIEKIEENGYEMKGIVEDYSADSNKEVVRDGNSESSESFQKEEKSAETSRYSKNCLNTFAKGENVFARWDEDQVWYNAVVNEVKENSMSVIFNDYGNEADIVNNNVVRTSVEIPLDGIIDENIITSGKTECNSIVVKQVKAEGSSTDCHNETLKKDGFENSLTEIRSHLSEFNVMDKVFARWDEDNVWYNALIDEIDKESIKVTFVDYGNQADIAKGDIVRTSEQIPMDHDVDENVVFSVKDNVGISGKFTEVKKSNDCIISVEENADQTKNENGEIMEAQRQEERSKKSVVDKIVTVNDGDSTADGNGEEEEFSPRLNFVGIHEPEFFTDDYQFMSTGGSTFTDDVDGTSMFVIDKLVDPVDVTILADGDTIAIVCRRSEKVLKFSRSSGKCLGELKGLKNFEKPTNILLLHNGEIAVRDGQGIHLFNSEGIYNKDIGVEKQNRYFGLAEDSSTGNIITLNCNIGDVEPGNLTDPGETDIFFINVTSGKVWKRVEIIDLINEENRRLSCCRALCSYKTLTGDEEDKVIVLDKGLDLLYCVSGEEVGDAVGGPGSGVGSFSNPSGVAADYVGNLIVTDTNNNRLQLLDGELKFCGAVKVDRKLVKPVGIFFDAKRRELLICNQGEGSVVGYRLRKS